MNFARDVVEQAVDLVVGDPGLRGAARMEAELLHPTQRGQHRHHQQAPVARRERSAAGPHAPRHRREVVLELDRGGVGVGGHAVDVGVTEHRPPHRPCREELLGFLHLDQTAGSTMTSMVAAPLSGTRGCRQTSTGNDTFTSE